MVLFLKKLLNRFFSALLIFAFSANAVGASKFNIFEREKQNLNQLSEYIYGDEVEQKLIPVYLLGAVSQPGLYHVPVKTDLTTLLAIAGGPTHESSLDEITIRNEEAKRFETIDYEKIVASTDLKSPILSGRDVVLVSTRQPAVSNDTLLKMSVVTTVLTVVLTGLLIKKEI